MNSLKKIKSIIVSTTPFMSIHNELKSKNHLIKSCTYEVTPSTNKREIVFNDSVVLYFNIAESNSQTILEIPNVEKMDLTILLKTFLDVYIYPQNDEVKKLNVSNNVYYFDFKITEMEEVN